MRKKNMGNAVLLRNVSLISLVLWALCSCQSTSREIRSAPVPEKVFVNRQFRLKAEFFEKDRAVAVSAGDIEFKAQLGTVQGDIYRAPERPGQEDITVRHIPSGCRALVRFAVLPAPGIILDIGRDKLNCEETISVVPVVTAGDEKEEIASDRFVYRAERGSFENNRYRAPAQEGKDTIEVYYPPLDIKAQKTVEITSDEILVAELPATIPCNGQTPIAFWLKSQTRTSPVSAQEVDVRPEKGKWAEGNYIAPSHTCRDRISIEHKVKGQKTAVEIEVEAWEVKFSLQPELNCEETLAIFPKMYRSGKELPTKAEEFNFSAARGKFSGSVYQAPGAKGQDTITVVHSPSGAKNSAKITILYSPYRLLETDRFKMPIPTGWERQNAGIGFMAKGTGKYSDCSIAATVLPGFDFLDIATMKLLFQQQLDSSHKNVEETNEDEIDVAGTKALRINFQHYGMAARSWWVFIKREGASYILIFQGTREFFDEDKIPDYVLQNFEFKDLALIANQDFRIPDQTKDFDQEGFTISIPATWQVHNISGGLLSSMSKTNEGIAAISEVHENGRALILFILAHRQPEVRNFDLSLLLVLLRQMIKDAEISVEKEVQDIELSYGQAKLLEIEGGSDIVQRTWLIATKYESTAYGILIRGPVKIWEANPDLPEKILKSFTPKQ